MTDAPERIWACVSKNSKSGVITLLGNAAFPVEGWQEYIRADAAEAALAAQIEADAGIAWSYTPGEYEGEKISGHLTGMQILNGIRNQPHDRTALDRLIAKAEADALRRAAGLAHTSINQGGLAKSFAHFLRVKDHDAYHQAVREYEAAILAMIPRDGA